MFLKRHLPVAVKRAAWIDAYRKRGKLAIFVPTTRKEIPDWNLDRRLFLMIPVKAQDQIAPGFGNSHPNVLNHTRSFDDGQIRRRLRRNHDVRVHLPTNAEFARGVPRNALLQRTARTAADFSRWVFRADGARLRVGKQHQIAHAVDDSVKHIFSLSMQ
ncbi:hypothetical protein SDC9_159886 [bioreactor metagenome]|uniref:Uncharacterized protein n=1 Tax=bioreactor metagenome TaxID=1076179 RepID=A0A645FDT9_9ZZZZ